MAIKISGTTVIDDSRNLTNIGGGNLNFPTSDGSAGDVLTTDGEGNLDFTALVQNDIFYTTASANTTLESNKQYRIISSANTTLTLPASPATGDTITFQEQSINDNGIIITVARNGNTIEGIADDIAIDTPYIEFQMWYDGTTWRLY